MDALLFGHNEEANVVAVQPLGGSAIRVYTRTAGRVETADAEFYPFFHLSDSRFIEGFPKKFWLKKLDGNNFYQYLCAFPSSFDAWDALQYALRKINAYYHTSVTSYLDTEHILFRTDMTTQYLLQSGMTLFKGMDFSDLYRMQIDIQVVSKGHRVPNAERRDDRIVFIALSDSRGWQKVLGSRRTNEKKLLEEFIDLVRTKDPDVIEAHNCHNVTLPYLMKRCQMHEIECGLGRDGSAPSSYNTRTTFGESAVEYMSFEIAGRHIIDTWILAQQHDSVKRAMEGYTLKHCAQFFNLASANRRHIHEDRVAWYWENEPDTLEAFASDNAVETRALSDLLLVPTFYLAQMLPFNFGTLAKLGPAAKIESIFLRAYIRRRHSLPKPKHGSQEAGAYADVFATGVFGPIVHAEIESLYPSVMLAHTIRPGGDVLDVFLSSLRYLVQRREEARMVLNADVQGNAERARAAAHHAALRSLINSFYGYLSYSKALFNDYEKADEAASLGEDLLRELVRELLLHNGTVIEVDAEGIFFVPPDNVSGEKGELEFVARLSSFLPEGIQLIVSGRYRKMLSYKKKNFAVLQYDDKVRMKGQALLSRTIEKFGRIFIQQTVESLLNEKFADIHMLYNELVHSLRFHEMNASDFSRTETLRESIDEYEEGVQNGSRNRSAAYEAVIQSKRMAKVGDKVTYYVTGKDPSVPGLKNAKEAGLWDENFPDENTAYYLKRLDEYAERFSIFFSERDFKKIFTSDDLFGFDAEGICVLNKRTGAPAEPAGARLPIELDES
ncbi:MAG TPA: DNA polymerase domain-containing protein [Bacteroidota bacterium]|nr:DNA polymerase domain-containing protein [Bacteroidota bacterium]